jgi:hypothetical protein
LKDFHQAPLLLGTDSGKHVRRQHVPTIFFGKAFQGIQVTTVHRGLVALAAGQTDLPSDRAGRGRLIARDHDQANPGALTSRDGIGNVLPRRVEQADQA